MLCKICSRHGSSRDGGSVGLCWQHVKRKCGVCHRPSAGEELCTGCAHDVEVKRWTARAEFRLMDREVVERMDALAEARREKLFRGKFLFHEAVEVFYAGLLCVFQAVWGEAPKKDEGHGPVEHREAA